MRRHRVPRIVRPRVFRIPPLHFLLHFRIGAFPETAQVLRDLQRPSCRRQQVQGERHATLGDARRLREAEQFLQLHRQHRRCGFAVVVERVADVALHARRHRDARGREPVDALAQVPVDAGFQRFGQCVRRQRIQPGLAGERGLQPRIERCEQGFVGQVGQAEFRHPCAQAARAHAPLRQRLAPRQRAKPEFAHRVDQRLLGPLRIDATRGFRRQHDAVEAFDALAD